MIKQAIGNPDVLYIGIDATDDQLKKTFKKIRKQKIGNIAFWIGDVFDLPPFFDDLANKITILFPWGSLLEGTVLNKNNFWSNIGKLLKRDGQIEIVLNKSALLNNEEISVKFNSQIITEDYEFT